MNIESCSVGGGMWSYGELREDFKQHIIRVYNFFEHDYGSALGHLRSASNNAQSLNLLVKCVS